ncbi:hypothetical protein AC622_13575 [Bacillus sp. FJAT-27916]|uniref:hypothetical protein n=1 Tax=Bacillaceae TaxID=186817 RepID=UPI0006709251|nr:hypothetical protein [Bacillus sp. FJAT-27916]KMY45128.1 hypothetical protein AC622_13575 [Bacillus sp. FJAT-27916]
MKQAVNHVLKATEVERHRKAVLRMEMDYELATLFEAMEQQNEKQKTKSKQKLERIRRELMRLKAI